MGKGRVPRLRDAVLAFLMFQVTCIGWVFFRAETLTDAVEVLSSLARLFTTAMPPGVFDPILPILVPIVAWEWWHRHAPHGLTLRAATPVGRFATGLFVLLLIAAWGEVRTVPFIYFQF